MPRKSVSFEDKIQKLEKIVTQLNSGDLPLEKGVKLFKEGMELVKECNLQLAKAKSEIKIYLEKDEESN